MDKDTSLHLQALARPTLLAGFFGSIFRGKYNNKLILLQNSEIYTHYMSGLINVSKLFESDTKSFMPEHTVHNQHTFRFVKCKIHTN